MNTRYKDSVFTLLFNDPARLRELYNALSGSSYGDDAPVTINTLSDALFMERRNDISFTIGDKLVVLLEHQSTVNRNMPLRFLLYIGRVYEKIIAGKAIYREKRIEVARPEFMVLYNGAGPAPDEETLSLSDAFAAPDVEGGAMLELKVKVYNVNEGHNRGILERSGTLGEYAKFVAEARGKVKERGGKEGLKEAIAECIKRGILKDFLKEHSSEVINMLYTEWNWDDAKEVWQEEAREEGWERGTEKVLTLMRQGYTADEITRVLAGHPLPEPVAPPPR